MCLWFLVQAIWVLAINSDFLISISLLPDVVNLWYFKLRFMLDQIVWNIIELQKYRDCKNRVCVRDYFHAWRLSQFRSRFPVVNLVAVNVSVYLPLVVSEISYTVNVLMSQCVRATVYIFQGCKRKGYYSAPQLLLMSLSVLFSKASTGGGPYRGELLFLHP